MEKKWYFYYRKNFFYILSSNSNQKTLYNFFSKVDILRDKNYLKSQKSRISPFSSNPKPIKKPDSMTNNYGYMLDGPSFITPKIQHLTFWTFGHFFHLSIHALPNACKRFRSIITSFLLILGIRNRVCMFH